MSKLWIHVYMVLLTYWDVIEIIISNNIGFVQYGPLLNDEH